MTLRIATVNVNGVRAARRKGMDHWLDSSGADVVCLQEVRAPSSIVDEAFPGWRVAQDESGIPGRAGVAILSRLPLGDVRVGIADAGGIVPVGLAPVHTDLVHTGRWVEATVSTRTGPVRIVSAYVHSGEAGTSKMDDKMVFLDLMTERLGALAAAGARAVVLGDINIAHTKADIKNWRGNLKAAGFLPEEREYLDRWLGSGWVDVHRALAGLRDGPYTWWLQWGTAFENDTGWRIDYQLATSEMAASARSARVDKAPAADTRWSDHAPLVIEYAV